MKHKKFENPFVCDKDGKRITNPTAIYEHVREHFYNHFHKNDIPSIEPFVGEPEPLKKPICIDEVIKAIKKLNNNRAADIDGMTAEFLKHAPREVHEWIVDILNDVLQNHSELDLGTGILVALQKPGKEKGPVKHLRPVILLLILRKILSNITFERIKPQYENYISPAQSAYRSKRSTADIVWAHRWIAAKAQKVKIKIFITGLDMSAAFDTIKHDIMLRRLSKCFGISGKALNWFQSYLKERTHTVVIGEDQSSCHVLSQGVPQGSVLGPVLFTMYTSPLESLIDRHNVYKMFYADDTQLYIAFTQSEVEDVISQIASCVKAVKEWSQANGLKLNSNKTEVLHISFRFRSTVPILSIDLDGTQVHAVKRCRSLGVTFDDKFTMENFVKQKCQSAWERTGL